MCGWRCARVVGHASVAIRHAVPLALPLPHPCAPHTLVVVWERGGIEGRACVGVKGEENENGRNGVGVGICGWAGGVVGVAVWVGWVGMGGVRGCVGAGGWVGGWAGERWMGG